MQDEIENAYKGLWPSAKNGSTESLVALSRLAEVNQDQFWLERAASLNSLEAQLALAELVEKDSKAHWLKQAADNGHAASQFELSLIAQIPSTRYEYLKMAAKEDFPAAVIALADRYVEEQNIENARQWLEKAALIDLESAFKLARLLWLNDEKESAKEYFELASNHSATNQLYNEVANKPQASLNKLTSLNIALHDRCSQQLQFVATSLDSAVQAEQFKQAFAKDSRFSSMPICVNEPVFLKENELSCISTDGRKSCDLSQLANQQFKPAYTHLVLFIDESKAYVENGVMYLDGADLYSVFVHELAHFVGFVDEYAVSENLSAQYCRHGYAPNMLVAQELTPEPSESITFQSDESSQSENVEDSKDIEYAVDQDLQNQAIKASATNRSLDVSPTYDVEGHQNYDIWQAYLKEMNAERIQSFEQGEETELELTTLDISESRTCSKTDLTSFKPTSDITFMEYHDSKNIPELYRMMWSDLLYQYHHEIAVGKTFALQASKPSNKTFWQSIYVQN